MWRTVIWKSVPRGARTGEEGAVDVDAAKAWVRGEQVHAAGVQRRRQVSG